MGINICPIHRALLNTQISKFWQGSLIFLTHFFILISLTFFAGLRNNYSAFETSLPALQRPEQSQCRFAGRSHALLAFVRQLQEPQWVMQQVQQRFHSKEQALRSAFITNPSLHPARADVRLQTMIRTAWCPHVDTGPYTQLHRVSQHRDVQATAAFTAEELVFISGHRHTGWGLRCNAETVQVMEQKAIGQMLNENWNSFYLPEGCWHCLILRLDLSKTSIKYIPTGAWMTLYKEKSICQENGSRNSQQFLSDWLSTSGQGSF